MISGAILLIEGAEATEYADRVFLRMGVSDEIWIFSSRVGFSFAKELVSICCLPWRPEDDEIHSVLCLTAMLLLAPPAFAYDYTIEDNYWGADAHGYGDVIGTPNHFGIDRMEVGFSGHESMTVKVYTPFTEDIAGYGTEYGDLFISTNGWNPHGTAQNNYKNDNAKIGEDWEYVFDTSGNSLFQVDSNTQLTLAQNAPPASSGGYVVRNGQEVLRDTGGTQITDNSFFSDSSAGTFLSYAIEMSSLGEITGDIGLKWSMTCANDSIEGSVPVPTPEPSTMLLLGSGLVGLAFYRRRKK